MAKWDISLFQAIVFSAVWDAHAWATIFIINEVPFYWLDKSKVCDDFPTVGRGGAPKPDSVYKAFKALASKGLIEYLNIDGRDLVRVDEAGKDWFRVDNSVKNVSNSIKSVDNSLHSSDTYPTKLGYVSEGGSDTYPRDNNIILDTTTARVRAREEEIFPGGEQSIPSLPAKEESDPNVIFAPGQLGGYIATEARDKLRQFYTDEKLMEECALAGRDLPLEVMKDLLFRFTTHPNFTSYSRMALQFQDLRAQFLKWIKRERPDLRKIYFGGAELLAALKVRKPDTVVNDIMAEELVAKYKGWLEARQPLMDALTVDEMATCLVRAGSGKAFFGALDLLLSRRDLASKYRRQFEGWKDAMIEYEKKV